MQKKRERPHHYAYDVWATAKKGYDNYAWVFFIATLSTLIAASLKITGGVLTIILAFAFFYFAGRFHTRIEKWTAKQK